MISNNIFGIVVGIIVLASGASAISATAQDSTYDSLQVSSSSRSYQVAQTTIDTAALEASTFQQINQYRASLGLPALARNSSIDAQARIHSQNMASGQVAFGHQGFATRIQATGIAYRAAAENVAKNRGYSDPVAVAVRGWLNSPGHLANIKGNYNLTGVGVARNSRGEIYFTQIFIRK
ncbi:MAG: CAP domain-containing protein [Mojavia pulchra JT2-VF2]|uniref:CAP domain-containing protein n=1 Tax=Mojavia pulchra JT2-VF2 TaxID=287848 RepID=A0A951Q0R1_9NOST|nr:CAP domain-containing protein [Mojavia pulchra JT2-VF2]